MFRTPPAEQKDAHAGPEEETARRPRCLKGPDSPTEEELREHLLTHLPYKGWCEICVACRRPNAPHRKSDEDLREIPLMSVDYCFVQDSDDFDPLTVAVARVRPSRLCTAFMVPRKGSTRPAIRQLASFIKEAGLTKFVWKSDQEAALNALVEIAIQRSSKDAEEEQTPTSAVPEQSSVGESASNGFIERGVQLVEDLARTMKYALQARLGQRIGNDLAVMQ